MKKEHKNSPLVGLFLNLKRKASLKNVAIKSKLNGLMIAATVISVGAFSTSSSATDCRANIDPVGGANYTVGVWSLSDLTVNNAFLNHNPFPDSNFGQHHVSGSTFTINANAQPQSIGVNDSNSSFNHADFSQVLAHSVTMNGVSRSAGTNYVPEYSYLVRNSQNISFSIYVTGFSGARMIGIVSSVPMVIGETYTFVSLLSHLPTVRYSDLANSYFDPTGNACGSGDNDGDGNPNATDPSPDSATARNDSLSVAEGDTGYVNVLANDDFLPNNDSNLIGHTDITRSSSDSAGGPSFFNTNTGELAYAPVSSDVGKTVTLGYEVCNTSTNVCDHAQVAIAVSANARGDRDGDGNPNTTDPTPDSATASNDSLSVVEGSSASVNVLANDDFLPNNDPNRIGQTTLTRLSSSSASGNAVLDANTGVLTYTPLASEVGRTVSLGYEVCNASTNVCDQAQVAIAVSANAGGDRDGDGNPNGTDPAPDSARASNDSLSVVEGSSASVNVLANDDFLPNNDPANTGSTTLTRVGSSTSAGNTSLDAATGVVSYTPVDSEIGRTVTLVYEACNVSTNVCAQGQVAITVVADANADRDGDGNPNGTDTTPGSARAVDDELSVIEGESKTVNVLANDDFLPNNDANNAGVTTLTRLNSSTAVGNTILDAVTGNLTYTPVMSEAGRTVSLVYQVCNASTNVCAQATVVINVVSTCPNPTDSDADGLTDCEELRNQDDPSTPEAPNGVSDPNNNCSPNNRELNCDADNDGIPNSEELGNSPDGNPDDDRDTDNDGTPDFLDLDSDGDNILDAIEAGGNPMAPVDSDNDSMPDYIDSDSNNDTILDVFAGDLISLSGNDADNDGIDDIVDPDQTGGTDAPPMNGVDDRFEPEDTDGDGIPNYLDMDGDNDGIPNSVESGVAANPFAKPVDTDSDGIPDFLDSDSDNDSISDRVEAADNNGNNQSQPVDTDGDNVPDYIDLDSDNDSLLDIAEAGNNSAIRDANQDGLLDNNQAGFITQSPVDSDNDGVDDYRDLTSNGPGNFDINTGVFGFLNNGFGLVSGTEDADGDGIVRDVDADDTVFGSGKLDTDRDGIPDEDDQDADNDGISNTLEGMASLTDTDNDSVPDYRDVDSDNDGLSDLMEGRLYDLATEDFNRDGLLDYDVNNDGRIDANRFVDANNDGIDDNFSVVAISDLVDTDQDGLADFRDIDSDGDRNNGANLTDAAESVASSVPGFIDTIDADGDGALDLINRLTGQPENPLTLIDNDADGVADYKDFTAPVVGSGASVGTEIVTAVDGAGSIALLQMFALFVLTLIKRYKVILLTGMSSVLVFFSSQSQATNICAYFVEFEEQESITSTYDHLMGKKKQGNSEFNSCWYLGAGLGLSFLEPIGTDVNGFTTPDDVTEGTAGHVSIGYRLTEKLFAELKYASLGKVDLTNISTSAKADISYSAISLLAGYYLKDADDKFKPYVKAGISSLDTSASEGVIVRQATSAQFAFGIGAEYRYGSSPWFPRLEIDFYDKDATYASFSFNRFIGGGVEEVVYQEPEPVIAVVEPKPVVLPKEVQKVCDSFNAVIDDINFAFDSAKLNDISIAALLNYARSLKMYPDTKVLVSAHTDSDGDADYNLNLSQKRAESVMQFFIDSGVSSSQLRSKGFGENKPIAPNTTLAGRAANRRVELSILESKTCY